MTSHLRLWRLVAAGVLVAAGMLGFAAPAGASSGGDSVMIDNAPSLTIYSGQSLSLSSVAKATCKVGLTNRSISLTLAGPTGPDPTTQPIKSDHVPCDRDASFATSIQSPKRNGAYVVTLQNSSAGNTTATLDVLIPPARARGFSATTSGTSVTFSWSPNSEPDVVGYQILDSSGAVAASPAANDACGGGTICSATLDLGTSAAGQTKIFSVRALRCGLSCSDSTVPGPRSATVNATFAAAPTVPTSSPPTSPTPSPPSGHGGGGRSDGGGSTTSSRHGGKPHVPGESRAQSPSNHAPARTGRPARTKALGLGKPGGRVRVAAPHVAKTTAARTSTTTAIRHEVASGLTLPPLWRCIAAAAILLLIAMHLRTWAHRVESRLQ